ncbi:MAG: hypothetical protein QOD67_4007 [Caballeronia sp.]|jgi:hypothetical protein|nr:hypothetical protein [Caballeronia sp.]
MSPGHEPISQGGRMFDVSAEETTQFPSVLGVDGHAKLTHLG